MFIPKFYVYQNEAGGEGSTGGSGDAGDDVATKINAAVDEATSGLVTKNKELLAKLQKSNDTLKQFDGIDPVKIKKLLDDLDADEDTKLIKEGKVEELLNRKYEKRDKDWQAKLDAAIAERDSAKAKADKFLDSVLDDRLRSAFNGKVDPRSMKAALLEAKQIFKLDDEGKAVQFDAEGQIVLGKDKTPFSPSEWIESDATRKESPYLYPVTGSGTGANQGNSTTGKTSDLMKLPPAQRMDAARQTQS